MTPNTFDSVEARPVPDTASRLEVAGLVALLVFTVKSTLGYGFFALHPENLPSSESALRFYNISFQFFAQLHILIAFGALAIVLVRRLEAAWLPAFAAVYLLSFVFEHIGTGYGIPFGGYEYTGLLGARLGPRVPFLIPLSWFLMTLPCWIVARAAFSRQIALRVGLGAMGLVLWDLALDPAMSALTPYWRWEETGPYYGMPWMNLVGWFATGTVLMIALERLGGDTLADRLPVRWMAAYYAVVAALPLGMLGAAGEWLGIWVTLVAFSITGVAVMIVRVQIGEAALVTRAPTVQSGEAS